MSVHPFLQKPRTLHKLKHLCHKLIVHTILLSFLSGLSIPLLKGFLVTQVASSWIIGRLPSDLVRVLSRIVVRVGILVPLDSPWVVPHHGQLVYLTLSAALKLVSSIGFKLEIQKVLGSHVGTVYKAS
jgi:hypothetical protein